MGRKGIQLMVGLAIIGAGLVALASVSVSEFLEKGTDLPPQKFRVNGNVAAGSISRDPEGLGVTFAITDGERSMPVAYARELPDTFRDGAEVVVEGTVGADGTFRASTLLAKCPSKYEKEGTEHPEEIPIDGDSAR